MFFQNSTLVYVTKTLNQIILFFLHQNQNIFFSNIGNQNIFLEKTITPPLQVKWSFPKSMHVTVIWIKTLTDNINLYKICMSNHVSFNCWLNKKIIIMVPLSSWYCFYSIKLTTTIKMSENQTSIELHRCS
jgi:hypothetical protein